MKSAEEYRQEQLDEAKTLRRRMTPEERTLWHRLRTNKLAGLHFRRQHVVEGYIVDFYCPRARLVIEVDGSAHAIRRAEDEVRDEILDARGLKVLRVTNVDVQTNIDGVLRTVSELAASRISDRRSDDT
jgi:very-short-patch-repair endonuclease